MKTQLRAISSWHRPLVTFAGAMVGLATASAVGYVVDGRILVGVPIWAKPLKFSISFALYAVTLAWMVSQLRGSRLRRIGWWAGTALVAAATLEMTLIVLQVIRGQQSHFNDSTPFNSAVFAAMGALVGVIFLAMIVIAVVLIRQPPALDRAATLAIRLGLIIAVLGLSVGFLMLRPTAAQSALGDQATLRGAHSVGVADGGPAVPFFGWSTTGGDLRIPHFVGMHALQVLPLLAIGLTLIPATARFSERIRVRIVALGAVGYTGVFALTLWQALRGQPLTAPDDLTLGALAVLVLTVTAGGAGIARSLRRATVAAA